MTTHIHEIRKCLYCQAEIGRCPCWKEDEAFRTSVNLPCEECHAKLVSVLAGMETPEPKRPASCCQMRRKVVVAVVKVLKPEECGVPDSELADFVMHGQDSPRGSPIIAFKYCAWCGTKRDNGDEMRITEIA